MDHKEGACDLVQHGEPVGYNLELAADIVGSELVVVADKCEEPFEVSFRDIQIRGSVGASLEIVVVVQAHTGVVRLQM